MRPRRGAGPLHGAGVGAASIGEPALNAQQLRENTYHTEGALKPVLSVPAMQSLLPRLAALLSGGLVSTGLHE